MVHKQHKHKKSIRHGVIVAIVMGALSMVILLAMMLATIPEPRPILRTKAAETSSSLTVCESGCSYAGGTGLQQAVDAARDGDTILVKKGTYKRTDYSPFVVPAWMFRGGTDKCFLNLKGKNLTLLGEGNKESVLFGEGHDKPYVEPYASRAGICTEGGSVTIDNLKVKEFQKRCMILIDASVIIKNSQIEGCDEGGVALHGSSTGLFVNNLFVAVAAFQLWQNSYARVINNTLYYASLMLFLHPNSEDSAHADFRNNIVVNPEYTLGIVDWWLSEHAKLKNSTFAYNLVWKEGHPCYADKEMCDPFPGKVSSDPLFTEPVFDPRGAAAWANWSFKEGSPAIGSGDPSIPGTKDLGYSGGPCAAPTSGTCSSFIAANRPLIAQPTATPAPTAVPRIDPTSPPGQQGSSAPQDTPTTPAGRVTATTATIVVENIGTKPITLRGATFGSASWPMRQKLDPGDGAEIPPDEFCKKGGTPTGGILYVNGDGKMTYKALPIDCSKTVIIDIQ